MTKTDILTLPHPGSQKTLLGCVRCCATVCVPFWHKVHDRTECSWLPTTPLPRSLLPSIKITNDRALQCMDVAVWWCSGFKESHMPSLHATIRLAEDKNYAFRRVGKRFNFSWLDALHDIQIAFLTAVL